MGSLITIAAGRAKYYAYVTTENGVTLDLTNAVHGLGWEENEKELSTRISFDLYNAMYNNQRLSSIVKICQPVTVMADWGQGQKMVAQGFIKEAERDQSKSAETYNITAYDCLYATQKSQDNVYFKKGKKTKNVITKIFKKWGIPMGDYSGPNVKHAKIVYKNKKISDIIIDLLDQAVKKGGKKSVVRAEGMKVSVVGLGENEEVYELNASNCIESKYKISITDLVTKVVIVGSKKKKKNKNEKVQATLTNNTEYGVIQKIQTRSSSDSLKDAKKAAKEILDENSSPKKTRTIQAPDVPAIRKGDKIKVSAGSIQGYFLVKSIQHNAETGKMSLNVEKYSEA